VYLKTTNNPVTFQAYNISLLLHLSIELILVYVHKSTTFCQSLDHNRLRCSPLYWSLYSCVTLTVGLRQLTGDAIRRCGRAPTVVCLQVCCWQRTCWNVLCLVFTARQH